MKKWIWPRLAIVCLLAAGAIARTALAGDAPFAEVPLERITVHVEGRDYTLEYRAYPETLVLDLGNATGARDTPYHTLLSYYRAFARIRDWDDIAPFLRKSNGDPGDPPPDEAAHIASARQILSGDILIFGEILYQDHTIYVYRYAKSIKRHNGLPVRRFGDADYVVVQDLVLNDPLIARLSALRWEVARLKAEHAPE